MKNVGYIYKFFLKCGILVLLIEELVFSEVFLQFVYMQYFENYCYKVLLFQY